MKITNEHFNHIKTSIESLINQYGMETFTSYKAKLESGEIKCNDVNTRFMYDVARKAYPASWVCDNIYPYADDSHYKTALFKAGKELNLI